MYPTTHQLIVMSRRKRTEWRSFLAQIEHDMMIESRCRSPHPDDLIELEHVTQLLETIREIDSPRKALS